MLQKQYFTNQTPRPARWRGWVASAAGGPGHSRGGRPEGSALGGVPRSGDVSAGGQETYLKGEACFVKTITRQE